MKKPAEKAAKETAEKLAKEAAEKAAKEAIKKAGQEAAEKAADEGATAAAQKLARKKAEKLAKETAEKAAKEAAEKATKKAAKEAAEKAAKKAAEKATKSLSIKAAKNAAKQAAKTIAKKATQKAASVAATSAAKITSMGPVGVFFTVFELVSIGLDMADPMDLNSFVPMDEAIKTRNILEAELENRVKEGGAPYPSLIPFQYALDEQQSKYFMEMFEESLEMKELVNKIIEIATTNTNRILEDNKESMINSLRQKIYQEEPNITDEQYQIRHDSLFPDEFNTEFSKTFQKEMETEFSKVSDETYDKIMCTTFNWFQNSYDVTYIDGIGCTLREHSCKQYNESNFSKPKNDQGPYGLYSTEFRTRDPSSNLKEPKMILQRPSLIGTCKESYLLQQERSCKGQNYQVANADGEIETVSPKKKGTWVANKGLCDYSAEYCNEQGLKHVKHPYSGLHDCIQYDGSNISESIFGKTVTRGLIVGANEANEVASDSRLKKNITFIKKSPSGIPIYSYQLKHNNKK